MLTAQESTDGIDMDTEPPRTFTRRILPLRRSFFEILRQSR